MFIAFSIPVLLFMLIAQDSGGILDSVTKEEQSAIDSLPATGQVVLISILSGEEIAYRSGWRNVKKGEVFRVKRMHVSTFQSQLVFDKSSTGVSANISISRYFIADKSVVVGDWGRMTSVLRSGDVLSTDGIIFECRGPFELVTTGPGGVQRSMLPQIDVMDTTDIKAIAQKIAEARGYHVFQTGKTTNRIAKLVSIRNESAELQYLGKSKTVEVPMDRFAEEDRLWLRDQLDIKKTP